MIQINIFAHLAFTICILIFGFWLGLNQGAINVKTFGAEKACEMILSTAGDLLMEIGDLSEKEFKELYPVYEGPFSVYLFEKEPIIEDNNGLTVCHFNVYTQLPLTDANMKMEDEYWLERANQICEILNKGWNK